VPSFLSTEERRQIVLATSQREQVGRHLPAATRGLLRAVVDELRGSIVLLALCLLVVLADLWR
jgi:hypothetical protein